MPPPLRLRLAAVVASLRRCRTVHLEDGGFDCGRAPRDWTLPWRDRRVLLAFAWRTGVRNPGSVWCSQQRGDEHHVAVFSR